MLPTLVALLGAATIAVPLTRRLGLGSVLGYLLAGVLIGPSGLRLVTGVSEISDIASLGVVMLLFLIGLELRPRRLWVMRQAVFALGPAQVVVSAAVLAALAHQAGIGWAGATVLGAGLALSSTAIVLPMLAEADLLKSPAGRDGFAVLLFQDLAFIPLVAVVPLLAEKSLPNHVPWHDVASAAAAVAVILVGGRFAVPPLIRAIGGARTPELFTTVSLLIVAGTAYIAHLAGLSMSLGAFMAGVLLSQSEYRHELQADIAPFEGLLLGFFFISVGMSADLGLARAHPGLLAAATAALLLAKVAVAFLLARVARQGLTDAVRFSLALNQASEFSFVLFGAAVAAGALAPATAAVATLVAAVSMAATPVLFALSERFLIPRLQPEPMPDFDTIEAADAPVIIAGFGRFGQVIGRVLRMYGIRFTALERNIGQVNVVRRFGNKVYFGDPTRAELLRAAGAEQARLLIIALDHPEDSLRILETARRAFPQLKILARARNRRHAHLLMDRGVDGLVRETFHSSLKLAEEALEVLGVPPEEAVRSVTLFRDHDERNLRETLAIYRDEQQLIQSTQQATEELTALFEADQRSQPAR
ncbi:monovalent cation:proton antiporter-2 (CPA2) family protein [Rhodopila globiformis]|uniref:Glutathione-regulated potassium-efflux system protein KefB n=1 Tax=Rhodopila globiformis TaxID=1071 RepID=A0A2S6N0Z9_RHOGL|nr:monovalent cation:proton antiporter-2 (CPA2) family protein [Rhodopila globiformis]PPQ28301.1 glutathione-regulated potassium-efflux system protein KefB [Rhodopila globiformis]